MPVAALAQMTGIDPFPALPERVKATAMARAAPKNSPYTHR
jgi:hypothetical protein